MNQGPADMLLHRRSLLGSTLSSAAMTLAPTQPAGAEAATLGALAAARGIVFGMAVTREQLEEAPRLAAIAATQPRMIVPGMELKWSEVHPGRDRFAFEDADAVMGFVRAHGALARGHTLLWHEALPDWVTEATSARAMTALLENHVRTIAGRYRGRMHSWDVVNEVIHPGDSPTGLRDTPFLRALGPDYVDLVFRLAREADPQAVLTVNEYDLEMDTPWQARRRRAMLDLLEGLLRRGVPVGALGIQGHLHPRRDPFNPAVFRDFLRAVAGLGLQVFITELDVIDGNLPADTATRDRLVAEAMRDYLAVALAEPAVRLVVTWGISDRYTWVNNAPLTRRRDGLAARPHLYDDGFRPKPAWEAMAAAFRAAPRRGAA